MTGGRRPDEARGREPDGHPVVQRELGGERVAVDRLARDREAARSCRLESQCGGGRHGADHMSPSEKAVGDGRQRPEGLRLAAEAEGRGPEVVGLAPQATRARSGKLVSNSSPYCAAKSSVESGFANK